MINKSKTKDMQPSGEGGLQEFHFPGGGEYEPLTITARSREEAEKDWQEKRSKVETK